MRRRLRRFRGQTLVMFATMLIVLLGFVGLSIDVGYLLSERRAVQNAADAAALAAGSLLSQQDDVDHAAARDLALDYATNNGYGSDVSVFFEPVIGPDRVRVEITHPVPKFFIGALYGGDWSVTSVAESRFTRPQHPYAMLALDPDGKGVEFTGNASIDVSGGSVGSNSTVKFNGNAVSGQIDGNLVAVQTVSTYPSGFTVTGTSTGGQGMIENPFATDPPAPVCETPGQVLVDPLDNDHVVVTPGLHVNPINSKRISLQGPGDFCFMSTVKSAGSASGLPGFVKSFYKEEEDPEEVDDENEDAADDGEEVAPEWDPFPSAQDYDFPNGNPDGGVMLYFGPNADLDVAGSNSIQVQSLGAQWRNIVIWFDNCNKPLNLQGNTNMWLDGVVYAPCSAVELGGNNTSQSVNGAVIGAEIKLHGNVTFGLTTNIDNQAVPRRVYLVE